MFASCSIANKLSFALLFVTVYAGSTSADLTLLGTLSCGTRVFLKLRDLNVAYTVLHVLSHNLVFKLLAAMKATHINRAET